MDSVCYSMDNDIRAEIEAIMREAPDEQTKQKLQALMAEM